MADSRTFPPNVEIIKKDLIFTADNFMSHGHNWPFDWYARDSGPDTYLAPSYNMKPANNSAGFPANNPNVDTTAAYYKAGWFRSFYPNSETLWDTTNGIGANTITSFLEELDFHHTNGKKYCSAGKWYNPTGVWGLDVDSIAYEKELIASLTAFLTNPTLSGLGFTIATHPAFAAFEPANEYVNTATLAKGNSYARMMRIVHQLFAQYKPACKVVNFSGQGGNGVNLGVVLGLDAVSIDSPKVAVNGDDGTGKVAADYIDTMSWHYYQSGTESKVQLAEAMSSNRITTGSNIDIMLNHSTNPILSEILHNTGSPLFGTDIETIPYWITEGGIAEQNSIKAHQGGARFYQLTREKELELLIKGWTGPACYTRDGNGNPGVAAIYKFDIPGPVYTGRFGTNGTISNVQAGSGTIRITVSGSGPTNGWEENMKIMITAPNGWPDLGLAAGEKARFDVGLVDVNSKLLEIKGKDFTAAPTGTPTYTEFQTNHSPSPEAWSDWIDIMTGGKVTYGLINYEGSSYQGIMLHVEGLGTWYSGSDGTFKKW